MQLGTRINTMSVKARITLCFMSAVVFAIAGFSTLFIPTTSRTAILGVTVMCFVCFYAFFSKGYDLRAEQRALAEGAQR